MKNFARFLLASTLLVGAANASAHHSFSATFQEDAKITLEGVVTNFSFKNPHVLTYFDVTNEDGTTTEWIIEGSAATLLRRRGFSSDTIQPGMYIRAMGDSTHDGSPMITMDNIDLIDPASSAVIRSFTDETAGGDETEAYSEVADTLLPLTLADGKLNISGSWATTAREDGGRPRIPSPNYNALGVAKQDTFQLAHDPQVFCDAPGVFRQAGTTPHPFVITQTDDAIIIEYEEYGGRREIPYGTILPVTGVKSKLGDAVAQIEDDKIIITTVNLMENMASPEGTYLSDEHYTVETFYRDDTDESSVLQYEMIAHDPKFLNAPMRMWKIKGHVDGYEMIPNDCHSPTRLRTVVSDYTSFFLTSEGLGDGGNLGGLAGADAHCEMLAAGVGQGGKDWRAFLSTTGEGGIDAVDRIGNGPWYSPRGDLVAASKAELIAAEGFTKQTSISERSELISGRGDDVNRHDILTGTQNDGTALENGEDTTCSNWTSNSETGSALVGHHDRIGGGNAPNSWTHAHGSRGCSQENLQGTGGDGLFYCFAANPTADGIRNEAALSDEMKARIAQANLAAANTVVAGGMGQPSEETSAPTTTARADAAFERESAGGLGWLWILLGALVIGGLGIVMSRKNG